MKVLITGVNGWVGAALAARCREHGHEVLGSTRLGGPGGEFASGNLNAQTDWREALQGREAVLHLAARVHVMRERAFDPLAEFREVNTHGTLRLAQQAAAAGVRRFVFVSSIKVNGERTEPECPFSHKNLPAPRDPYAISKREAEDGLREIALRTGMGVVIVRPPLVYGPGVKANFANIMRAIQCGVPLPLGSVNGNRRSLVALDNLVDLLITCVDHPAAANQTFLVSDGEDLSTADLVHRIGQAMDRPARLLPVPVSLLRIGAAVLGKREMAQRLLESLQVNISFTSETLGWKPPITVNEGLRRAAAGLSAP